MLRREVQRLAECLHKERGKLTEFKERIMRRKEHEAQKYQGEIKALKGELVTIEEKYGSEVKKLEEHYKRYREGKN